MVSKKNKRNKGKIRLSRMFQELKAGDRVAIERELGERASFPKRMGGNTGTVESKRGKAYIVKISGYNREKKFIIPSIHLKKLK